MLDFILKTGDLAMFIPTFPPAVVTVRPGQLIGSGKATINGQIICVDGDEKKVIVPGCPYITPVYSIPGVGNLLITSLAPNQRAIRTKSGGKPVLLKGGTFQAKFQVVTPAQIPSVFTPDSMLQYAGFGTFITTNMRTKAT